MTRVSVRLKARWYQQDVIQFFRNGGKRAVEVWNRRAGKDRTAIFIESELACKRVGLYWHALPEFAQARRVIWDAITKDGERLIDVSFPPEIRRNKLDHDMKIELINGSIWQPVGADNFNSLVGSNPLHVTYSEYALMSPVAREYLRPILAENNGTELFISTPRGYNHFFELYKSAQDNLAWHTSHLTVDDTQSLSPEQLAEEKRTMPEELFRQEYYCDFSAANVGAILGRWVEQAEKENRVRDDVAYDPMGAPIEISSDIGRRDTAAWWFWQPRADGFALIDYDDDSGLDATEWCLRLKKRLGARKLGKIWLPQDAKAKTFSAQFSAVEQFLANFSSRQIEIVPRASKGDQINAARAVMPRCHFNRTACAKGLKALRAWQFEWNPETLQFSQDPKHDWSSHGGDSMAYGALVMRQYLPEKNEKPLRRHIDAGPGNTITVPCLEELYAEAPKQEARI